MLKLCFHDPSSKGTSLVTKETFVNLTQHSREELLELHHQMLRIRLFEEKVNEMYTRAKIGGYCHLNNGEEACIVGAYSALEPEDYVFTYYRDHGHALARGVSARAVMAELFGKETGCSKGRGGSMHLFDTSVRFMGGHAIVGGQLPLSVGVAFAIKYRGGKEIVISSTGEGATNIGAFNESMNLAQLWQLPVIVLCINNQYEMGTPVSKTSAQKEVWRKASAYAMAAEQVDGMDVLAVKDAVERAVKRAREDSLPTFIEALCYRFRGHSVIDPARYRTQEELEQWKAKDPVYFFQARLIEEGVMTEADAQEAERTIMAEVDDAVEFADNSPDPDIDDLYRYLYVEEKD
ncbi:MAG: pyruvate dehydrogenase (acetyl-transferring) component, alpha subunit [Dehalococcoidia bacterium]|nr:pyruvate dehydrogenase (acetyl-transferring) component, alpha subunit [Dehalococcoidia bacterium]